MKTRLYSFLLAIAMLLSLVPAVGAASDSSGTCGEGLTWAFDAGTLTISGAGVMDYYYAGSGGYAPWYGRRNDILSVIIEKGVENVGGFAFFGCSNLTEVSIPDSVRTIETRAFESCTSLAEIEIPDSVCAIEERAFLDTALYNDSQNWSEGALYQSGWLIACDGKTTEINVLPGTRAIASKAAGASVNSIMLPEGLKTISNKAFYDSNLKELRVPASVETIGMSLGRKISAIWVDKDNQRYSSDATGVLYNKEQTVLLQCPDALSGSYEIRDTTEVIGEEAFGGCSSLNHITIPNSVKTIEVNGFVGCGITEISVPDSVTELKNGAFQNCVSLTRAELTDGLSEISSALFNNCIKLTEVKIPKSVAKIEDHAFQNCGLEKVTIPAGVEEIAKRAFFGCSKLTDLTIEEGTDKIGEYAFASCSGLKMVRVPESVTWVGDSAFESCTGLTEAVLPTTLDYLGFFSFRGCRNLETVNIPKGITTISGSTFYACESLTEIVIPESVVGIQYNAFYGCTALEAVYFEGAAPDVDSSAFCYKNEESGKKENLPKLVFYYVEGKEGWTSPEWNGYPTATWDPEKGIAYPVEGGNIYFDPITGTVTDCDESVTKVDIPEKIGGVAVTSIGGYAFASCVKLADVTLCEGIVSMGDNVFVDCQQLKYIELPASLEIIGEQVFFRCANLKEIAVASGNNTFAAVDGVLFSKDKSTLRIYPEGKTEKTYQVPEGTKAIGKLAFSFNKHLTDVVIPDGLEVIGEQAFMECDKLVNVNLPIGLKEIGEGAFVYCDKLQKAEIPAGITEIPRYAFSSCYNLSLVILPESMTTIGESAFGYCENLTDIVIPAKVSTIGDFAFYQNSALQSAYFKGDAPALGNYVFHSQNSQYNLVPTEGLTLYYIEGKEGWASPEWNGYPTATWEGCFHDYKASITAPTCTEQGYTTYTCSCGDSYMDEYVAALGHDYKDGSCSRCGEKVPAEFNDVPKTAWYKDAVEYAVENGLMNGMGDNKFEPEASMTRAMLVTVLWRYAGEPKEGKNIFADIKDGQWYTEAVAWAAHNNIVGGVGGGLFDPDGKVTREQLATILYRYSKAQGFNVSKSANLGSFPDNGRVSAYAQEPLSWAVAEGLVTGVSVSGTVYLDPQGNATRAQVATILMRYIENLTK